MHSSNTTAALMSLVVSCMIALLVTQWKSASCVPLSKSNSDAAAKGVLLSSYSLSSLSTVSASDQRIYWTEWNWYASGESKISNNVGAYFKTKFKGKHFNVILDQTNLYLQSFMVVRISVDSDSHYVDFSLPSQVTSDGLLVYPSRLLHSSDSDSDWHSVTVTILSSDYKRRWANDPPISSLTVNGIQVQGDIQTPDLRPKRILLYADSLGEGVEALDNGDSSVLQAYPTSLAAHLSGEISIVAFGGIGWVGGMDDVPQFCNPIDDNNEVWDRYYHGVSRLDSTGLLLNGQPDYIFSVMGTNDSGGNRKAIVASIDSFLTRITKAAPSSIIFLTVPLGHFISAYVHESFENFRQRTHDEQVHLIDLGVEAGSSIDGTNGHYHPRHDLSLQLGIMLADAAQAQLP